jgi:REP element-mobilizing transposase RayT
MARQARKDLNTNVFSISQQADVKLFASNEDREALINIIQQAQKKFGFLVYAYCLLDDFQFKLIINTKKQSISRIMQSIGVSYTYYKNVNAKLFPRRFKSKALYTTEEVMAEVNNIHVRGNSRYNSYCVINKEMTQTFDWITSIDKKPIEFLTQVSEATHEDLNIILADFLKNHDCDMMKIQNDKNLRNECIVRLRQQTNCSLKQIGYLLGGLSESTISKIIKNNEQDS